MIPRPTVSLCQAFKQLQVKHKDNLHAKLVPNQIDIQKGEKKDEQKGLRFIAKNVVNLISRNKKIEYPYLIKVLINNLTKSVKEQKNLRRRIYDTVNVLVAAGVILKENNLVQFTPEVQKMISRKFDPEVSKKKKIQISKLKAIIRILDKIKTNKYSQSEQVFQLQSFMMCCGQIKNIDVREYNRYVKLVFMDNNIIYPSNVVQFLSQK